MAVTAVTRYSVSATFNGVTWSAGPDTSSSFTLPDVDSFSNRLGGTQNLGYIDFNGSLGYPLNAGYSGAGVQNGPFTVSAGTQLHGATVVNYFNQVDYYKFNSNLRTTVTGSTSVTNEGNRVISAKCSIGGSISSPSVGANTTVVAVTRPAGDISAAASFLTVVAGSGSPSTGTLLTQGYAAGVWSRWTWPSTMFTSGSQTSPGVATATTITLSLLAGYTDGTITANFTRADNSPLTWSPQAGNVVVHILDSSLTEIASSVNNVNYPAQWDAFRNQRFTGLSCTAGSETRDWWPSAGTSTFGKGAYLLNVPSTAYFLVTPYSGWRVYSWKLQNAAGTTFADFGSGMGANISGFEAGCKVHLYLTSATPNPRLSYDGFDATTGTTQPATQNVLYQGASYGVGSVWGAGGLYSFTATLSPVAWQTKLLGQSRSVLVDGVETPLANVAGTSANITSSAALYSVTRVKFKQTLLPTDGTLTVTIIEDTITPLTSIAVTAAQESSPLTVTTTETGATIGYYAGSGPLALGVAVNYGGQDPDDFVVRVDIPVAEIQEGDDTAVGGATLMATSTARAVTVSVRQKVNFGSLTAVDINMTRTVGTGTQFATSAGPVTQCVAGSVSVTMPAVTTVDVPITVECYANPGYAVKTLLVVDSATGAKYFYSGAAKLGVSSINLTIPQADDGASIKVILVMSAVIVGTPSILPLLPDDLGKFSAAVTSVGDINGPFADFRVGDLVTLTADVVTVSTAPLTGAAIGSPEFNGVTVVPVRDGTSVEATVTLVPEGNVFKIPVYAVLETTSSPAGAGTISLTAAWDVEDTLVIDAVTYRRIGSRFTVTAPLKSTTPSTYTVISAKVSRRLIAVGFDYYEVGALLPVVASDTTRTFSSILSGPTELEAVYAIGEQYPAMVVAAYDYSSDTYITQGVRPTVATVPVSPAALSDNLIADIVWPETGTPGASYEAAAFLYRTVTTTPLLPAVDIRITSSVGARLEMWNPATSVWVQYSPVNITLAAAFTYFRVSIGDPPSNLVSLTFEVAVTVDAEGTETDVPGCNVYTSSGAVYDGNFVLSADRTMQARSRSVLHARVTPPWGYVVTGWYVDDVLTLSGSSLSVVVPDTGLTLKPQLTLRQYGALTVMVMNADPNRRDDGMWISKLFRAQYPWKPLTATVVSKPTGSPVTLAVLKDGGDAPDALDPNAPGTVAITVTGDSMRRLPPGQIQKTRFVRYLVAVSDNVSVSSVAIGSGSETMKGGH